MRAEWDGDGLLVHFTSTMWNKFCNCIIRFSKKKPLGIYIFVTDFVSTPGESYFELWNVCEARENDSSTCQTNVPIKTSRVSCWHIHLAKHTHTTLFRHTSHHDHQPSSNMCFHTPSPILSPSQYIRLCQQGTTIRRIPIWLLSTHNRRRWHLLLLPRRFTRFALGTHEYILSISS